MRESLGRWLAGGSHDPGAGETSRRLADPEVTLLEAAAVPRLPRGERRPVAGEALSGELAIGTEPRGRQFDRVLDDRLVLGGTTDLDDLEVGRALEHPVPDAGRLQHAVAGLEHERLALVLVDQARPNP